MAFDKRKALQSALTFTQQGKWERAIVEYQAILKADPRDLTVCNNLGDLYARAGKTAEAIEQYLKLGELYRADGLSVKAIAVYKKIIKLDPNRIQALLACADLYEEQGLTGEAKIQLVIVAEHYAKAGDTPKVIELYQRLAILDSTNHILLAKLGDLLLKEGRREEAAAQYEVAAQAAEAAGHTGESKRLYKRVRDLTPASPQTSLALAEQLIRDGKHAEAVEALLKSTAGDATNAQAWRLLGEAYVDLGQSSEAITALEQAVGLGLPEVEVLRPLAKALVREGRTDEGISLCRRLSEDALSRGQPEQAIAACRDLLAVGPNLAPVHAYLVGLLQDLGREEEARQATWALAAAHEACGETEEAIHVYHELLEQDPANAEVLARLEALEGAAAPVVGQEELGIPEFGLTPRTEAEPPPIEVAPAKPTLTEPRPGERTLPDPAPAELVPAELVPAELVPAELVPAEPPALELSLEDALVAEPKPPLEMGGSFSAERRPGPIIQLDDSGELAGILFSSQEAQGSALDGFPGMDLPGVDPIFGAGLGQEGPALEVLEEEEEASGEIAEQLAEAEVYLKYGLTEKARERFLEVARVAPDHLVAHRRLKALYLDRPQIEEACGEILAIARILRARGQRDAAEREIQEGLGLAPGHADLCALLAELSRPARPSATGPRAAAVSTPAAVETPGVPGPEIPDALEVTGSVTPHGELVSDRERGTLLAEETGAGEAAASDTESPGEAPSETTPAFDLPEGDGVEASATALSPGPGLGEEAAAPQEEELPLDLRVLLEVPEEEPGLLVEAVEDDPEQAMADDLAEAEFYLSQEMVGEARTVYARMRARDPLHPAVVRLRNTFESSAALEVPEPAWQEAEGGGLPGEGWEEPVPGAQAPVPPSAPPVSLEAVGEVAPPDGPRETGSGALPDAPSAEEIPSEPALTPEVAASAPPSGLLAGPPGGVVAGPREEAASPADGRPTPPEQASLLEPVVPKFSVVHSSPEAGINGFVNLGAELEEELAAEERAASPSSVAPLLEDLLREFQKGVREHLDEKDFETHYNLGIAYKEMELYDEAIQEFRLASHDPERALGCADLLGLCFVAKGDPGAAIREFLAGLEIRGGSPEAYHALRYDLGVAYELQGDLGRAAECFEAVRADDERFRDVQARVKDLRRRLQQQQAASLPVAPVQSGEPAKRGKDKKNISFI